jgi:hypothetical protein
MGHIWRRNHHANTCASVARQLHIGGVARNLYLQGVTMNVLKDPSAVLYYGFDWTAWLQTDETIASANVTTNQSGLAISEVTNDATVVMFWAAGGTEPVVYRITCEVTTSLGRTDSRSFIMTIQSR